MEEALRCSDMAASVRRTVSAILHHSCCIMLHEYYNAGMQSLKLPPAKCQMPVKYVLCGRINKGHPSQWSVTFEGASIHG